MPRSGTRSAIGQALSAAWLHCETSFGVRQVQLHRAIRDQLGTQTTFRDGELGESIRFNQRVPPRFWLWTEGVDTSSLLPTLTRALVGTGYSNSDILKTVGRNLKRVLSDVLPAAGPRSAPGV